jgi:nicotinamide N-methyltransferase
MAEDPTDIFDTSLSSLFSIPPIAFSTSSPSAPYIYTTPSGTTIELKLPHPPPNLYTKLQANNLWLAGIFLADMIDTSAISCQGRVCELGAGAGLPGIVAGLKGSEVLSTDWGVDEVLDVIKGNFEKAKVPKYSVLGHEWGTDPSPLLGSGKGGQFDSLLLADTLWVTDAHSALLDSVYALLKPGGTAHIAAGLHTGRGPLERFVAAARGRGAVVEHIKEVRWNRGEWEDYVAPANSDEERGVVVYYTCTI